jgi:hypothetical protein
LRQTVADRPEAVVRNAERFLDKIDLNLMKILGIAPMWQTNRAPAHRYRAGRARPHGYHIGNKRGGAPSIAAAATEISP